MHLVNETTNALDKRSTEEINLKVVYVVFLFLGDYSI
jgi:hypothetical protein